MLYAQDNRFKLFHGDNRDVLKEFADNSIDSIVTDPPYELGFMGKSWDASGIAFNVEVWQECFRILKPGGHLLAFSGSRTYHRMAVAIEDAGFEMRDQIMWIYGSGFPKSLDVSKAIDKAAGAERKVVGNQQNFGASKAQDGKIAFGDYAGQWNVTAPATTEAKAWAGWGTALKPAHEPIVVARKPLIGTVAANVLTYGTGGLNIDGARVGNEVIERGREGRSKTGEDIYESGMAPIAIEPATGRWPANVIHDGSDEVVEFFGEPQRFFYCAKASKRDRNEGCEDFEIKQTVGGGGLTAAGGAYGSIKAPANNHHPTVKPTALMQYLCKLVTPPGGVVLDPFAGSGSTGKAAIYEGFNFVGIEMTEEYLPIAKARIEFALNDEGEKLL